MQQQPDNPYIVKADDLHIRLRAPSEKEVEAILALGFFFDPILSVYIFTATNHSQKVAMLSLLRDSGVYFSAGREWSPAEVFEYLRDEGKLSGSYQRISWLGNGEFEIVDA